MYNSAPCFCESMNFLLHTVLLTKQDLTTAANSLRESLKWWLKSETGYRLFDPSSTTHHFLAVRTWARFLNLSVPQFLYV